MIIIICILQIWQNKPCRLAKIIQIRRLNLASIVLVRFKIQIYSAATAVPIYRHSPYRDYLPNFGPYSDNFTLQAMKLSTSYILSIIYCNYFKWFIHSIFHDLKLRVHQQVIFLTDLVRNLSVATFLQLGPYSPQFGPYQVPISPKQRSLFGPYRDQVGIGMTCGHTGCPSPL